MDGDFANDECIVRDTTSALIRIIIVDNYTVRVTVPNVCVSGRGVELTRGEECYIAMVKTIEGQINRAGSIYG